jgi:outer membrane protein assembly factor BamA
VRGARATLGSTADYWKETLHKVTSTVTKPLQAISTTTTRMTSSATPTGFIRIFKSKETKRQEALLQTLQTMPIKQVTVPNSTVLPAEVIHLAAKRAGVLGNPLRTDRVQDFAATVKRWYTRQGYILHSVTGATLLADTATAEIQVQEPILAEQPVGITFCKELVVDGETGNLLTFRQYQDLHKTRRTLGYDKITKKDVNTTLVETQGRTKSQRIASALGLHPGQPFQWNAAKWRRIASSGVFTRILRAAPVLQDNDGTVQLQMVVQEAPSRHLEYGLSKSLYTGAWEGELDFAHGNLLGGGEHLGLTIRRGTTDAEPSVKLQFTNDRFGMAGGYDIEAFSDYIGSGDGGSDVNSADNNEPKQKKTKLFWSRKGKDEAAPVIVDAASAATEGEEESTTLQSTTANHQQQADAATAAATTTAVDYDDDPLLSRRGATFRLRNPFDTAVIRNSIVSASIERTMTKTGLHEDIGSTRVSMGPFVKELPLDARSNIDFQVTTGARVTDHGNLVMGLSAVDDELRVAASSTAYKILPYATVTATTKQVFPLLPTITADRRPVILALRHSVTTSTKTVPRHEAKSMGVANNIRGSSCNGAISSALRGTTELRVPVDIPLKKIMQQDLSMVLFHDWIVGAKDTTSPFFRKSSVGLGIRKSIQGLPVQYNLCYCNDGKIKSTFGLGRDFDV